MSGTARAPRRTVFHALLAAIACGSALAAASGEWNPHAVQPDLAIEDAQLAPAVETHLTLVYHRAGKATAMTAPVPLLQAGERQWLIVEVGAPLAQADAVMLYIDEPPAVAESDETNNSYVWGRSRP